MKYYIAALALLLCVAGPSLHADTADWSACKADIEKFQCGEAENDYETYRCLTKHDTQLSKECYTVTTDYERSMSGQ